MEFEMSPDHLERVDPGSPPSVSVPAVNGSAKPLDGPHHHRPYHVEAALDPVTRLEWLDDLMFAAIEGDAVALDFAADAWKKTVEELGSSALEESRRQYLRRAQTVWRSLRNEPNHPPHKVFAAIEIISLLAAKAQQRIDL
jgi:hypothetical protein